MDRDYDEVYRLTINIRETGKRIRDLRKKRGITISDLQRCTGLSRTAINKWQRGESLPTVDNLLRISIACEINIEDILVIDDDSGVSSHYIWVSLEAIEKQSLN